MSFTILQQKKKPFQAIKTRSSKSRKIDIFPKGLTHGFGPKMAIFPNFFFQAIQARKMSFTIFQKKKKPFQAIKTKSLKSRKTDMFAKGLTHGFGPKITIIPTCFFKQYGTGKCLLRYFTTKKFFLGYKMSFTIFQNKKYSFLGCKNKKFKKSKN